MPNSDSRKMAVKTRVAAASVAERDWSRIRMTRAGVMLKLSKSAKLSRCLPKARCALFAAR
ncbi:hypothetical protein D3C71_1790670 [compost metagenome]